MKRFLLAIAAVAVAFSLRAPALAADVQIVTPAYTLTCASHMQGKRVVLNCVPSHTSKTQASRAFDGWHYGQALPRAMFVQYVGNGAPAVCDGISINCSTGVVALNLGNANTWTVTQTFANIIDSGLGTTAGTPVCITVASQLTTAGCTGGGGDTITTPNSTLIVGGTSTATTLDLNLANANTWTATETHSAPIAFTQVAMTAPSTAAVYSNASGDLVLQSITARIVTLQNKLSVGSAGVGMNLANLSGMGHEGTNTACSGTGTFTISSVSGDNACAVTLSSGAATVTFHAAYSVTPVCNATDTTAAAVVKIAPSTTGYTLTGTSADVIDVRCIANGGI